MDVLILGASNAARWSWGGLHVALSTREDVLDWHPAGWLPSTGTGAVALGALLAESMGETVRIVNAAVGSSSLRDGWLGPLYAEAMQEVAASGVSIDAVVWLGGGPDAMLGVDAPQHLDDLRALLSALVADLGPVPLYLMPLHGGLPAFQELREAQVDFVDTEPLVYGVQPSHELGMWDVRHFNPAGHALVGDAFARAMLEQLGVAPAYDQIHVTAGTAAPDLLVGDAWDNLLKGSAGADLISGCSGDDTLNGGVGSDRIFGDKGDDELRGMAGEDTLRGGKGNDTMIGGDGADVFYVQPGDVVIDFEVGVDLIL